jgi:hypothetical protein
MSVTLVQLPTELLDLLNEISGSLQEMSAQNNEIVETLNCIKKLLDKNQSAE